VAFLFAKISLDDPAKNPTNCKEFQLFSPQKKTDLCASLLCSYVPVRQARFGKLNASHCNAYVVQIFFSIFLPQKKQKVSQKGSISQISLCASLL